MHLLEIPAESAVFFRPPPFVDCRSPRRLIAFLSVMPGRCAVGGHGLSPEENRQLFEAEGRRRDRHTRFSAGWRTFRAAPALNASGCTYLKRANHGKRNDAEANETSLIEHGLQAFLRVQRHAQPDASLSGASGEPSPMGLAECPRARGPARKSEVIVYGAGPEETVETIRRERSVATCSVSCSHRRRVATRPATSINGGGYRFAGGEAAVRSPIDPPHPLPRPILSGGCGSSGGGRHPEGGARASTAAGTPERSGSPIRLYGAFENETPIRLVSSVATESDAKLGCELFVHADYRRRGIGKSLMSAMLTEDAAAGVGIARCWAVKPGRCCILTWDTNSTACCSFSILPRRASATTERGARKGPAV